VYNPVVTSVDACADDGATGFKGLDEDVRVGFVALVPIGGIIIVIRSARFESVEGTAKGED
jgi:hypothetical protein